MSDATKFEAGTYVIHKLRRGQRMIVLSRDNICSMPRPMVRVRELVNFALEERYYEPEELEKSDASNPITVGSDTATN